MRKRSIGVIGGGVAGCTFVHFLLKEIIANTRFERVDITIYEPRSSLCTGLAYQSDLDSLLLNVPFTEMSLEFDTIEFAQWLKFRYPEICTNEYVPRGFFWGLL